ncbi:MAG: hypothetical protein CMJ64_03150 [Planctomycetaceae bacterium]|nr:hypothetical protein [Planctomycetaceae bacterium]
MRLDSQLRIVVILGEMGKASPSQSVAGRLHQLSRITVRVERYRESLLGPVIETAAALIVSALPLVLCSCLLHGLRGQDEDVSEVLVSQLVRQSPELLGNANSQATPAHGANSHPSRRNRL